MKLFTRHHSKVSVKAGYSHFSQMRDEGLIAERLGYNIFPVEVFARYEGLCALMTDKTVWCWGDIDVELGRRVCSLNAIGPENDLEIRTDVNFVPTQVQWVNESFLKAFL